MLSRLNEAGGTTLVLAEGDDLSSVPTSHRDLINNSIRQAFCDPMQYFATIAERIQIASLQRYLGRFVADGNWSLVLADTYMVERATIAAFQWFHADQRSCMFGLPTGDCDDVRFAPIYELFSLVHWESVGFGGGIVPYRDHLAVADYSAASINPAFPADSTTVFGTSACGDMMVCNASGDAGYLSHDQGTSYVVGSLSEMLDWVFGELIRGRTPEMDPVRYR